MGYPPPEGPGPHAFLSLYPADGNVEESTSAIAREEGIKIAPGWLPHRPVEGQRGGGGDATVISFGIHLGESAVVLIAGGYLAGLGADLWKRTKRALVRVRQQQAARSPDGMMQLAIQLRMGQQVWARLPTADLVEALDALDDIQLPLIPEDDFVWIIEWNSERRVWLLPLEQRRYQGR